MKNDIGTSLGLAGIYIVSRWGILFVKEIQQPWGIPPHKDGHHDDKEQRNIQKVINRSDNKINFLKIKWANNFNRPSSQFSTISNQPATSSTSLSASPKLSRLLTKFPAPNSMRRSARSSLNRWWTLRIKSMFTIWHRSLYRPTIF